MPVRKYRSVDRLPEAAFREAGHASNLRIACELSTTATRLAPRRFPSGVHPIARLRWPAGNATTVDAFLTKVS